MYSPAWPHSDLKEVLPDIFYVTGTNITKYNDVEFHHSRNMIVMRDKEKLSLINTVRLNDDGLAALEKLGTVENVIRIGAFHGRDDAFYCDRYKAALWGLKGMQHQNNRPADKLLHEATPFPDCSVFTFETSEHPEAILHIAKEGGILITCDSIKNWIAPDEFFNTDTIVRYHEEGFFGPATISTVWREACKVQASDFQKLKSLKFKHLISAHGEPLLNNADEAISKTIQTIYE